MKKRLLIVIMVLSLASMSVSALGIGGAFSFNALGTDSAIPGGALSLKLDGIDPIFGIGVRAGDGILNVGFTADYWMFREHLTGMLNIYAGPGAYVNLTLGDVTDVDLGLRIPVGLNMYPIDILELFVELAPRVGIALNPLVFPTWGIQGAVGFRFWF